MRRLPLGPIEAFVVVARAQSLAQAAAIMHLTVPALSRRIQLLEADLGVRLFRRLPRGLGLTEAGAAYLAALAPAWDEVHRATAAARRSTRPRAIKVSVMPTFAANWLVPRLAGFQARHAGLAVELETSAELVDLQARPDLDCAIRLGKGPWPGLDSLPLLAVDAVPVAAPGYFADRPVPSRPLDLLDLPLIGSHHQPDFWREWFAAAGIDADAADDARYRSFDNLQLVHEAAVAGMGIALGLDPVVRPYLESGRLRPLFPSPLFPNPVRLSRRFHFVRRTRDGEPGRACVLFRDWLLAEAAAFSRTPCPAAPASLASG